MTDEPIVVEAELLDDRRGRERPDWGECRMTGCDMPAVAQVTVDFTSRIAGKAYAHRDVLAVCARCQHMMTRDIVEHTSIGSDPGPRPAIAATVAPSSPPNGGTHAPGSDVPPVRLH